MVNIDNLTTEAVNENTKNIDQLSSIEIVAVINKEDAKIAKAIEKELPMIAKAIDEVAKRFKEGGRIIYTGAGSSGRIGVLDAVELTPTYSVSPTEAFGLLAGGKEAMYTAIEGAEDSKELALKDLQHLGLTNQDVVIGLAASGRTPYTIASLEYANEIGALSISITCNESSEMARVAHISIAPVVGSEVISGSTRMKAGTAQKMIVNMISTGTMIKSGKVYQNYMVHVQPTNEKLKIRAVGIVSSLTDASKEDATKVLEKSDYDVAVAIVMYEGNTSVETAKKALHISGDNVRDAITWIKNNA